MATSKKARKAKEELRLTAKFGKEKSKNILERRKDQRTAYERATHGLDAEDVQKLERKKATSRVGKAKERFLEGKRKEDPKRCLFVKGNNCSQTMSDLIKHLWLMRKPNGHAEVRKRKKDLHPFENEDYMLNLHRKHMCPLMVVASTSKKRPTRLVIHRTFENRPLDMVEFSVSQISSMKSNFKNALKPLVLTLGNGWDNRYEMEHAKSLLVDMFYSHVPEEVYMTSIERVVALIALPDTDKPENPPRIMHKEYKIIYKKADDSNTPYVELEQCGYTFLLTIDRLKVADSKTMERALRVPREEHVVKTRVEVQKGVSVTALGDTVGRIFFRNETEKLTKLFTPATRILRREIPEGDLRKPDKPENDTKRLGDES